MNLTSLYIIKQKTDKYGKYYDYYKIGISDYPEKRILGIDTGPEPCELLIEWEFPTREEALEFEQNLHKILKHYNVRNEWFCMSDQKLEDLAEFVTSFSRARVVFHNKEEVHAYSYRKNRLWRAVKDPNKSDSCDEWDQEQWMAMKQILEECRTVTGTKNPYL